MSYSKAKSYVFNKAGTYTVKYTVKNSNKPYRAASKTVKVTVKAYKNAEIKINPETFTMTVTDDKFDEAKNALRQEILKAVSIKDNGTSINSNKAKVDLNKIQNADGTYDVTISYKGMNGKTVSKTVKVTVQKIPAATETSAPNSHSENNRTKLMKSERLSVSYYLKRTAFFMIKEQQEILTSNRYMIK